MASPILFSTLLGDFTEVIDTRSPAEFAEDHIPGAINLPVLDDEERVKIGTLHKQASAFEAKKVGAALVSRHIADYLESYFHSKPASYTPLVYCWRGGNRSGSLTHVLQKVGFKAVQLDGGYKAYRRRVLADLETLPDQFIFRVICGPTGCGKSRLLKALTDSGAQILDLEALAVHRGSLLGGLPDKQQPSQKSLESQIWWHLSHFDPALPVYVESESKKIGKLRVPDNLLNAMRNGKSIWLEATLEQRVDLLLEEYGHFLDEPDTLLHQLSHLIRLRGHPVVDRWIEMINNQDWKVFVRDLLENHYDPAYQKSLGMNYGKHQSLMTWHLEGIDPGDFSLLAKQITNFSWAGKAHGSASL